MLCALGLSSAHVPLSQPDFPLTVAPRGTRLQSHLALPQVLVCTRLPSLCERNLEFTKANTLVRGRQSLTHLKPL